MMRQHPVDQKSIGLQDPVALVPRQLRISITECRYVLVGLHLLIGLIFAAAKQSVGGLHWFCFLAVWKPARAAESSSVQNQNRVC